MTTTIDYALMAGASYISNRPYINQFPVPSGWNEREDKRQSLPSGFEATYFVKGSDVVISFAGTNFTEAGDWTEANIPLAFGLLATQLKQAADYYLEIKSLYPTANISLTGHSLGGGLAALIAVMFDETAVTFDQAPFNQSALIFTQRNPLTGVVTANSVAQGLREYLADGPYANMLGKLDGYIDAAIAAAQLNGPTPIATDTYAGRADNVSNIVVQDEILTSLPFNRIGLPPQYINNSHTGASSVDLHSQALLSAFLQSDATAPVGAENIKKSLGQVTFKLTDLLKMVFDTNLYAKPTTSTTENFVERLVRHEASNAPLQEGGVVTADAMVTRFTSDLWKLAQGDGLTMSDGHTDTTLNNVSKALIAFAMQFYYEDTANAKDATKQLFKDLSAAGAGSNGVQFDIAEVSKDIKAAIDANQNIDLNKAKGYKEFFSKYINNIANFTIEEQKLIQTLLPTLRDWYVQAGANGMSATDTNNRGAFMLGGTGADSLTGGTANDLLLGNAGDDQLNGGDGADYMFVANDTNHEGLFERKAA